METKDSWTFLRRIENIIINYDWRKYGASACEAYSVWRECYQFAREKQLEKHGVHSLVHLFPNEYNDYEQAMMQRIAFARKSYLERYIRNKLPKKVHSDFENY